MRFDSADSDNFLGNVLRQKQRLSSQTQVACQGFYRGFHS